MQKHCRNCQYYVGICMLDQNVPGKNYCNDFLIKYKLYEDGLSPEQLEHVKEEEKKILDF